MTSTPDGAAGGRVSAPAAPLTVAAVAARLGVAPATLRTWDRRYGLGPSERSAGSHRRYSASDVERLLVMRRLTLDGVAPGDAARLASAADLDELSVTQGPAVPGSAQPAAGVRRGPATPTALVDAALAGDLAMCRAIVALADGAGVHDVERWWCDLLEPTLAELARRTVVDRPGDDAVLAVRSAAVDALRAWVPDAPRSGVALVLVPGGQDRPLLVHALAAALVAAGVDARVVGGPTNVHHVLELVVMTRPGAVVTVSARADADLAHVAEVARAHPALPQFVMVPAAVPSVVSAASSDGRPGLAPDVAEALVGPSVVRSRTFRGLLHEVLAVAGGRSIG